VSPARPQAEKSSLHRDLRSDRLTTARFPSSRANCIRSATPFRPQKNPKKSFLAKVGELGLTNAKGEKCDPIELHITPRSDPQYVIGEAGGSYPRWGWLAQYRSTKEQDEALVELWRTLDEDRKRLRQPDRWDPRGPLDWNLGHNCIAATFMHVAYGGKHGKAQLIKMSVLNMEDDEDCTHPYHDWPSDAPYPAG
jgi:hypothetical protein